MNLIALAESGFAPDYLIRVGIRRLLSRRARIFDNESNSERESAVAELVEQLRADPVAVATDEANHQHYEVPAEFFRHVLGPRLKYSACLFESATATLAEAEDSMLRETCRRAGIVDGMKVLELGCGWGSLTLWMAEHYPNCQITAISNSQGQRQFIEEQSRLRSFDNASVVTANMRDFTTSDRFDRIVSVEMFEHMRNYEILLRRLSQWLTPEGKTFVHIFCHRQNPYLFETDGPADWMGRHFFTGGMMPSEHLFDHFGDALLVEQQWRVDGMHYWRTCEAWLRNLDAHRAEITALFERDLSKREAQFAVQRWRMFFMACAELFRYRQGQEWFVGHYLMGHTDTPAHANGGRRREPVHS